MDGIRDTKDTHYVLSRHLEVDTRESQKVKRFSLRSRMYKDKKGFCVNLCSVGESWKQQRLFRNETRSTAQFTKDT